MNTQRRLFGHARNETCRLAFHRWGGVGGLAALVLATADVGCGNDSSVTPTHSVVDSDGADGGTVGDGAAPSSDAGLDAPREAAPYQPKMADLIGANGRTGDDDGNAKWRAMGLHWSRNEVGPGQPTSAQDPMDVTKTSGGADLGPILLRNNANGIKNLVMLGYTPGWNALVPGDSKSAPVDVAAWENYVEAAVKLYSGPPYDVKHFQIWNEAAGSLAGGAKQATFWHGPPADGPYANAMQDYVDRIHIPAAKIIRKYGANVVYGGWPDQGGLDTYMNWLEYPSTVHGTTMLDWVDYLDLHYLGVFEEQKLYERYGTSGKIHGIWQTEIGDAYMIDQNYLPTYFFTTASWALDHGWNDPNAYVSMIYHWIGGESFRLTNFSGVVSPSGHSLETLTATLPGRLARFDHALVASEGVTIRALCSDDKIVFQVAGGPGARSVDVDDLPAPTSGHSTIDFIDGVDGTPVPDSSIDFSWSSSKLSASFTMPGPKNDVEGKPRDFLGYLVVTPLP